MEYDQKAVGLRIKQAREAAGMTQSELAEEVGVISNTIAVYERGKIGISFPVAYRIARALEVRLDWLADGTGEPSII